MNDRIYLLSANEFLRQQLKIEGYKSAAYREMADAEYVLRFLTLSEQLQVFSGSLVREMDEFMRQHQKSEDAEVNVFTTRFEQAITGCQNIWGNLAFRRPEGLGWRDQTLAGMYDAQMISVSQVTQAVMDRAANNQPLALEMTRELFNDPEFDKAVRTGTNTPQRIRYRVQRMKDLLEEI